MDDIIEKGLYYFDERRFSSCDYTKSFLESYYANSDTTLSFESKTQKKLGLDFVDQSVLEFPIRIIRVRLFRTFSTNRGSIIFFK